jgi:hypothetical protein
VRGRHANVDHHDIGRFLPNQRQQLRGVVGLLTTSIPDLASRLATPSRSRMSSSARSTRSGVVT